MEAALAVLAGAQPCHRAGLLWQRRPPGDSSDAGSRLGVVGDTWESSTQLDSCRQLSLLMKHITDRGGICLGDDEHSNCIVVRTAADKRGDGTLPPAPRAGLSPGRGKTRPAPSQ
jgi:hypothetical protein